MNGKELDSGRGVVSNARRNREPDSEEYIKKRRKTNRCNGKCENLEAHFGKSLARHYSNFLRSALPDRVLFYAIREWKDLPRSVVDLVRIDFQMQKTTVEVELEGQRMILDFLHMLQVNLDTGMHRPVAWIDDRGNCFFPELYSFDSHKCSECLYGYRSESNVVVQRGSPESVCKCDKTSIGEDDVVWSEKVQQNRDLRSVSVRDMFLTAFRSSAAPDIVGIYDGSGLYAGDRMGIFSKQLEITMRLRGHANIQYAWLLSCKAPSLCNRIYPLGIGGLLNNKPPSHGTAVLLYNVKSLNISASSCDVDENGVCYAILCRVIVGRMELLSPGSSQSCPSSVEFDTGVDNLENPKYYIVWLMNVNTHIFPQYVVSFKFSSPEQDCDSAIHGISEGYSNNQRPASNEVTDAKGISKIMKAPRHSWIPYTTLFSAFADKISAKDLKLVYVTYHLFKTRKINQCEFIQQLRLIVGETVLKSTLRSMQAKFLLGMNTQSQPSKGACRGEV